MNFLVSVFKPQLVESVYVKPLDTRAKWKDIVFFFFFGQDLLSTFYFFIFVFVFSVQCVSCKDILGFAFLCKLTIFAY